MKKTEIIAKVTQAFGKVRLGLKQHSPEILVTAGVAGTVVSTVLACKATTKIGEILEEPKHLIEAAHIAVENETIHPKTGEIYTQKDANKDLAIIYAQTGIKLAKLYAPAIIVGVTSITCIFAGNNILRKRAVAMAAAYAAVDQGFKDYRERVKERFGDEVDKELRYNVQVKEIEKTVVNEDGTETTVKETVKVADPKGDFRKVFDELNFNYHKDSGLNRCFLEGVQQFCNDKLRAQGYLFLNEVYDELGFDRTRAGQVVGWVYDVENPDHKGDNYVDFGMYEFEREKTADFLAGVENAIVLDFNVDGPILDYLPENSH